MDYAVKPLKTLRVDNLAVEVYGDRADMGCAAGLAVAGKLRELLSIQPGVKIIFAAAPSQDETLAALCDMPDLGWPRVTAMHMDEYIGLPDNAPQLFGRYLARHIFGHVHPGRVHYLNGNASSPESECARYEGLLRDCPADIVCMGIGENGHIAFNDPPLADFNDPRLVKVVRLEERSREQQVHDGCFASLGEVPSHALTLTIPALMAGRWLFCMAPGQAKAEAVARTLKGPITPSCPASILRRHEHAVLYLDVASAAGLA
jgi:glucosamine-6-phosphate deaminase